MAEPGEFTKRAFLNGKIDLVQAEAVAKLIHSKSLDGANFNNKILSGHLSKQFYALKKNLLGILASIEYSLDISEEEVPPNHHQDILKAMTKTRSTIAPILDGHKQAQLLTSGATVVIAGQPNVGKSTLLNKLSNSDRAIVSEQPGTTRDSLSVSLLLSGVLVTLIDTAGLRVAKNTIEEEGVSRAKKHIKNADLVIFLSSVDIDETPTHPTSDPRLSVLNKIDIPNNKINAKNFDCSISAKEGSGIKKLLNLIKDRLSIYPSITDSAALTTSRQYNGLLETDLALALGIKNLRGGNPALELAAVDVRRSIGALDVILGKTTTEEILDNIFKSFCVGK
jgi:tRNA modification GTPase